jgi:hypothetical protein
MKDYFKKLNSLIAILLIALSLTFVGCSDDDDDNGPTKTEAELLLEYLETTVAILLIRKHLRLLTQLTFTTRT